MKQTLLAFLAMSTFSLLALSQQRVMMRYHSMIYGRDYELAAMNMVAEKLAVIKTKAFDEADVASGATTPRSTTDDLSASLGLDAGESDIIHADDVDDFHGYTKQGEVYEFQGNPYVFDWSIQVCYLDANLECITGGKSLLKEVVMTLEESLPEDRSQLDLGRPPIRVQLKRVYSPAGLEFH